MDTPSNSSGDDLRQEREGWPIALRRLMAAKRHHWLLSRLARMFGLDAKEQLPSLGEVADAERPDSALYDTQAAIIGAVLRMSQARGDTTGAAVLTKMLEAAAKARAGELSEQDVEQYMAEFGVDAHGHGSISRL